MADEARKVGAERIIAPIDEEIRRRERELEELESPKPYGECPDNWDQEIETLKGVIESLKELKEDALRGAIDSYSDAVSELKSFKDRSDAAIARRNKSRKDTENRKRDQAIVVAQRIIGGGRQPFNYESLAWAVISKLQWPESRHSRTTRYLSEAGLLSSEKIEE